MPCITDVGGVPEITGGPFAGAVLLTTIANAGNRRRRTVADADRDVAGRPDVARRWCALQSARRRAERRPRWTVRDRERQRIAVGITRGGLKRVRRALRDGRWGRARDDGSAVRRSRLAYGDRKRRQLRRRLTVADVIEHCRSFLRSRSSAFPKDDPWSC